MVARHAVCTPFHHPTHTASDARSTCCCLCVCYRRSAAIHLLHGNELFIETASHDFSSFLSAWIFSEWLLVRRRICLPSSPARLTSSSLPALRSMSASACSLSFSVSALFHGNRRRALFSLFSGCVNQTLAPGVGIVRRRGRRP